MVISWERAQESLWIQVCNNYVIIEQLQKFLPVRHLSRISLFLLFFPALWGAVFVPPIDFVTHHDVSAIFLSQAQLQQQLDVLWLLSPDQLRECAVTSGAALRSQGRTHRTPRHEPQAAFRSESVRVGSWSNWWDLVFNPAVVLTQDLNCLPLLRRQNHPQRFGQLFSMRQNWYASWDWSTVLIQGTW